MRRLVWLIITTFPVAIVAALSWFGAFTFVNAYMVRGLRCTNDEWTRATLWLSVGMLLWYPTCTEITSRIGRRRTVTLGLGAAALGFAAMAFTRVPALIGPVLAVMGFAVAAHLVAWTPYVAQAGRDKPAQAMTLNAILLNLVAFVAVIAGGQIVATERYRTAFLILAVVCGLCTGAFHVFAKRLEALLRAEPGAEAGGEDRALSMRKLSMKDLADLAKGPLPVILLLGIFAAPFCFHTSNQLFPNLARDVHGFSEGRIATLVGLGRIPSMITLLAIVRIVDRVNIVRTYSVGLFLDGIVLIAVAQAAGPRSVAALYLSFYLCHGLVWAAAFPSINKSVSPRLRDSAFAITCMVEMGAVSAAGAVHHLLLLKVCALPFVFTLCALVTAAAGLALLIYSFTAHSRRRSGA